VVITPLLETLKYLEQNGINGKILTSDYLNFSEPKALKKLLEFSNIAIKMYLSAFDIRNFNPKRRYLLYIENKLQNKL